jgi:hypothetical protein
MSDPVRGYFQWRGSDDEEQEFVESPDGHYVVAAEQRARWDRTLSAMAQMQAEIEVLCAEQGPEPRPPQTEAQAAFSKVMQDTYRPLLDAAMRTQPLFRQATIPAPGAAPHA